MTNAARLFERDSLIRYPNGLLPDQLTHKYVNERQGSVPRFEDATLLLDQLGRDVVGQYKKRTGNVFNKYNLGEMTDTVRAAYITDRRFLQVLQLLNIDPAHIDKITLPWWNEIAANELEHHLRPGGPFVLLGPRHSYETQLARRGVSIVGLCAISVAGILETADGYFVIGLRGGAAYPNTFHMNAGALRLTPGIKSGNQTFYGVYAPEERAAELGLADDKIVSTSVFGRVFDWASDDAPLYTFHVVTNQSFADMTRAYEKNSHADKEEHTRLVGIKKDPESVLAFVRAKYRGIVSDDRTRGQDRQYLLHPTALALLSMAGFDDAVSTLQAFYQSGIW